MFVYIILFSGVSSIHSMNAFELTEYKRSREIKRHQTNTLTWHAFSFRVNATSMAICSRDIRRRQAFGSPLLP